MSAQGSLEWRQQRVGRITASRVGAIMGVSPFTSRKATMKDMVSEALGNIREVNAPPLRWGNEHEGEARRLYGALYAEADVIETGLIQHPEIEWLAASPDGLVGDDGLVEIKCPYGIRDDAVPEFKSANDQESYMHQIQCQLFVTGRKWCDLFQWTPNDYQCERIAFDPEWFASVEPELVQFMAEYEEAVEEALSGGAESVLSSDAWTSAVDTYLMADRAEKDAKEVKEAARKSLISLAGSVDEIGDDMIKVQRVESKGRVNYSKMAKDLAGDGYDEKQEEYRGKGSVTHRITIMGDNAA